MASKPSQSASPADGGRGRVWRFAGCEFDELRHELRVGGTAVDVEAKPLDVLHQLLIHAGEVVTKEELLETAWPGVMVVDGSLATAVSKLRKALQSDGIIVTVSRVGYRMGVPVHAARLSPPSWPALHLEAGQAIGGRGQWRLVRRLDHSPSSDVWLAEHPKTRQVRVFKFAADADGLRGLKREVTLARLLRQSLGERSDFVRLLEWNFDQPPYFIESDYCGPNLAEWAEASGGLARIPLDVRLQLLVQVTRAVAAAHTVDVLHKDLKPGNILVAGETDGTPAITVADLGSGALRDPARLAALSITNLGFTHPGADNASLTGTILYMAPEVLSGQSPSEASDVYALGVLLYQLVVADFRRPLAPGWEAEVADSVLREDIAAAACGDPARRLSRAVQLEDRLLTLDRRRRDATVRADAEARAARERGTRHRVRRLWLALGTAALIAVAVVAPGLMRSRPEARPPVHYLAVLPFHNSGTDASLDYLRVALPTELVTTIGRAHGIAMRPFAAAAKYAEPDVDVRRAARELGADGVVTGRFYKAGSDVHVSLEVFDLRDDRGSVWRDTMSAPAERLIDVLVQLELRVRRGVVPMFGGSMEGETARPGSAEAYELYLRGASLAYEAGPNPDGRAMLERAVALDPHYAPAWVALGRRYYVDARYGSGTSALMQRYEEAMTRAVTIDPHDTTAAAGLVVSRVERGDLAGAARDADALVRRRPDSADAHFAASYVLRFAGLLQEAGDHCESALLLDPRSVTSGLRSCAIVFSLRGDYARAANFVHIAPGSGWPKAFLLDMLVRDGRAEDAARVGPPQIPQYPSYDMLAACAAGKPSPEIDAIARTVAPVDDPEGNYLAAAHLAHCGRSAASLDLLKRAIGGNYCSTAAVESDVLFARLRPAPDFPDIRTAALACREAFVTSRARRN